MDLEGGERAGVDGCGEGDVSGIALVWFDDGFRGGVVGDGDVDFLGDDFDGSGEGRGVMEEYGHVGRWDLAEVEEESCD